VLSYLIDVPYDMVLEHRDNVNTDKYFLVERRPRKIVEAA
jgi:hypothetical protein